jgi:hypothetical protein
MKARLVLLVLLCCDVLGQKHEAKQHWVTNLRRDHGFQTFDRAGQLLWSRQQGVVFITPDRLAVYQVNERLSPAPLASRDLSGGAGNFFLDLKILDVDDGHEITSMRFPTNGAFSEVAPAGSGKFVVRTGDVLYLVSPSFRILASKALPLDRIAPFESWQVAAPRSGAKIVLVHQQIFIHAVVLADGTVASPGKSKTEVEVLDTDTLKVIKEFSFDHPMQSWSPGDQFLVGTHSSQPNHAEEFGMVDFDGRWRELKPAFKTKYICPPLMDALDHQLIAAYGCNGMVVFSPSGDQIFSINNRSNEMPTRVDSSGDFLAIEFSSLPNLHNFKVEPSHVDLFELKTSAHLAAVPLQKSVVYHDVSAQGSLAVLEGDVLRMFGVGN